MGSKQDFPSVIPQFQQSQSVNLTQRLIMSAHMQQAIHLLQLPLLELEPFIEEQIVSNPLLEIAQEEEDNENKEEAEKNTGEEEKEITIDDRDLAILTRLEEDLKDHFSADETPLIKRSSEEEKLKAYLESSICCEPSLYDQLLKQAHETFEQTDELEIAETLIGYIDGYGFLKTPLEEISLLHNLSKEKMEEVLHEIQTFEPYGVGASSIQESLLIQLRCLHKENSLAYELVKNHYEELLHNQIPSIQKSLKCSYETIQTAIEQDISKLDLHPGLHFSPIPVQPIVPDVTLRQEGEQLFVEVDRDRGPALKINHQYLSLLNDPSTPIETKQFIKRHLFSARWLMRNLHQRYSTIERIAQSLADKQYEFFTQPDGQLKPLTMKVLAEELNVHESTIARTVSNKYLNSPRGLFPLRAFFTTKYVSEEGEDLSAKTVKDAILELIAHENKQQPLSDEKISILLKQKGIPCARRTVAKYRLALQIGNAQQRKKFH